ncbi:methyltransferase domain-containing protein [Paenibacillus sp. WLX1005]|uniref:class I SAM-dependent methyltransferase n=1 Tax=Paenibacillus sp. WLX1005 TaxID=3243766 RepID=UPI00398438CB
MDFTGERYVPNKVFGEIEVEHKQRYHAILDFVKNKKVLDAACGEGYGTNLIAQHAEFVSGIDISEDSITWARNAYQSNNIEFHVSDIQTLPLEDHSVDVVISFETIEHVDIEAQKRFLQEIKRVLKPDGVLIMSTPDKRLYSDVDGFTNPFHLHEFYEHEFQDFLQRQFSYTHMFRQGFKTFSYLGLGGDEVSQHSHYRMDDIYHTVNKGKYLIAVCSDKQLGNLELLNSIMPLEATKWVSQLQIDYGNGFSDKQVVYADMQIEGREFNVTFDLEQTENIRSLKWIPLEGQLINIDILDYPEQIEMISLNSFGHRGSYTEFQVSRPEYLIHLHGEITSAFHLSGYIEVLNSGNVCSKLQPRIETLQNELVELQTKLQNYDQTKEKLSLIMSEREYAMYLYETANVENQTLLNSTSWKLTRPLRAINRIMRKFR